MKLQDAVKPFVSSIVGRELLKSQAEALAIFVALPIFYGVMGLLAGALGAVLYNVFAGMVGGVAIDVE